MKTNLLQTLKLRAFMIPAIVLCLFAQNLSAQESTLPPDIFVEMACFKAKKPGTTKFFMDMGKPFHEEMIKQGMLLDWAFYAVDYPNGADCDCDYREIRVFRGMGSLDKINDQKTGMAVAKKVFPEMDIEKVMADFRETVEFKGSRIYHMTDELVPGPVDGKMVVVNFMDVKSGKNAEYLKMEKEVFKPLHKVHQEKGLLKDWILGEAVLPYGTDFDIDYVTADVYDSYTDMSSLDMMAAFKKAHPGKDANSTLDRMDKIRKLRRAEVWKLVTEAQIAPPAEATSSDK